MKQGLKGALAIAITVIGGAAGAYIGVRHFQNADIRRYENSIAAQMRDPDSAQFRDGQIRQYRGVPVYCGQVNAKNAFGAYVGFRYVVSTPESIEVEPPPADDSIKGLNEQIKFMKNFKLKCFYEESVAESSSIRKQIESLMIDANYSGAYGKAHSALAGDALVEEDQRAIEAIKEQAWHKMNNSHPPRH